MKKHSLTELQFLDQRIKLEKGNVYSHGVAILPGITALTLGALANDQICMTVGAIATAGGIAATKVNKKLIKTRKK